jgi:hypothetical protein
MAGTPETVQREHITLRRSFRWSILAFLFVAIVLLCALYWKGDVKAVIKTPVFEFSIDTKDKSPPQK